MTLSLPTRTLRGQLSSTFHTYVTGLCPLWCFYLSLAAFLSQAVIVNHSRTASLFPNTHRGCVIDLTGHVTQIIIYIILRAVDCVYVQLSFSSHRDIRLLCL